MPSLTPKLKLNVLRGLSTKMNTPGASLPRVSTSSPSPGTNLLPKLPAGGVKPPSDEPVTARLQRKINPDYMPKRQFGLTNKLY